MKNLVLIIFIVIEIMMVVLFFIDVIKKSKKIPSGVSDKESKDIVNGEGNDSDLSIDEVIRKFHILMGYPHQITGLNRSARRKIKRQHIKFLWGWYVLPEEKRNVKKICEYIVYSGNTKNVFNRYYYRN